MALPVAATLALSLALATGAGGERLLLCRPRVGGDPALARAEAVAEAGRRQGRFLDYGAVCEDPGEGSRAARRVGLSHAVSSTAEGRLAGSRYVLVLSDAGAATGRAEVTVEVPPGKDAVEPLRDALARLARGLSEGSGRHRARTAAWTIAGAGAVAVAAGTLLAVQARNASERANAAADPGEYARALEDWKAKRTQAAIALGAGGAALAAGLGWRFAF